MYDQAPAAAVAALFLGLALAALANFFSSHYRVYGLISLACALRGVAYAMRAAFTVQNDWGMVTAWWALTSAGLGFAVCNNAAVLGSWYRNAKAASRPAGFKPWIRVSQATMIAAAVFGPVMGVAAAGLSRGGRTFMSVVHAANVKQASVWGVLVIAAIVTLHCAVAFLGSVIGFAAPPPQPRPRTPASSGGGGAAAVARASAGGRSSAGGRASGAGAGAGAGAGGTPRGSSSGGGGGGAAAAAAGMGQPDPERGAAEHMDLGEPISIIATVIEEGAEGPDAPDGARPPRPRTAPAAASGGAAAAASRAAAAALGATGSGIASPRKGGSGGGGGGGPAAAANPDPLVGALVVCSALLTVAAALRAASMYAEGLWWSDRLLFPLQALPELLSALLLVGWPHFMARVGMASRYSRWQPKKGKPATSRPKNSNPAIWKRAGLPAPESRTQTMSEACNARVAAPREAPARGAEAWPRRARGPLAAGRLRARGVNT